MVKVVRAGRNAVVTITSADTEDVLATPRANKEGKLETKIGIPEGVPVPCAVRATTGGGTAIREVANAPQNCGEIVEEPGGGGGGGGSGATGGGIAAHQGLTYRGPGTCLGSTCHDTHAEEIFDSTHYQWKGLALYMVDQSSPVQGKHAGAVNTYCGNILGNWNGCSACHVGLGAEPELVKTDAQLANIDCLICHQEGYKRKKVDGIMQPDEENMSISMDLAVQTVHMPTRVTCLQCHAKAGGGDALKRGDLALATGDTADRGFDVHMATTGANLTCQDCHVPDEHKFPGKGSDIRPTDLPDVILECTSSGCHSAAPSKSTRTDTRRTGRSVLPATSVTGSVDRFRNLLAGSKSGVRGLLNCRSV